MTGDPALFARYGERLETFRFDPTAPAPVDCGERLAAVRAALPALPADCAGLDCEGVRAHLDARAEHVRDALRPFHAHCMERLAVTALHTPHAFQVLFAHTLLLDAVHRFAFETALAEFPALLHLRRLEAADALATRQAQLPRRRERLAALARELERDPVHDADAEEPGHYDYLARIATEQRTELDELERSVAALEAARPALDACATDAGTVAARLVLYARGGYGRAEMSFTSDVDTGYALDAEGLAPAQKEVYHELVLRVERLLHEAGLETAHQFFELGEDLSRFTEPDTLHTIPSILESRALAGNAGVLEALQAEFRAALPFERLVRRKIEEFDEQPLPDYTAMDLKEERGGLRSIQVPLWLLGITHEARSYTSVELLELARAKGLLSVWEVSRLLLALELLYDLRNFLGAAERYYYDREARESGFYVHEFAGNRLNDPLARLYLFRTQRFESIDAFDTYRLRLVAEVQQIAPRLLARVLDRTVSHHLGGFRVSVHLGHKRIIAVESAGAEAAGADPGEALPLQRFSDARALLTLLAYIATTGYTLTAELEDALAGVVTRLALPEDAAGRAEQAALLSELMGAPFAHRALETLFAVSDPLEPALPTLIGRFVPAFDAAVFLLRRFDGQTVPLHTHIVRSVAGSEAELAALRRQRPELYELLGPLDVLALKWALLLQALGRLPGASRRPSQIAERAAEVLAALGYEDPELERRVRLLIEHHATVAALARTATYMDQALARYFEIAGRDLANVTLLYLVNLAVLQAQGEATEVDVASLRAMFHEANEMLGEMRGFPMEERSLELINVYFDRKKQDLVTDTRLHLLLQRVIAHGLHPAVLEPLRHGDPDVRARVQAAAERLDGLQREIVLGGHSPGEQARLEERLLQGLRHELGRETVRTLTAEYDEVLSWFFAGFPNRYLMASLPEELGAELAKFAHFREANVIVDVVSGAHGASEGLLIYLHGLSRPHTRVAYALSRSRVDINSGKVNCVELAPDDRAYCYYFQIATLDPEERLVGRDLELMIATESPPELALPERSARYQRQGARVEFRGDDAKGYRVVAQAGRFQREDAALPHLRVVLRDEPYLFYRVARAFDLFDVEVCQALITTIGNQVVDYFYLTPDDYERLRASSFEEVLISLAHSDLLAMAR